MSGAPVALGQVQGRRSLRWVAVVVAVVGLVLGTAFATRFDADPRAVRSPLVGRPVPGVRLPTLGGEGTISLADSGASATVVNFWASWCVPCRAEHGELAAAHARYASRGVRFVGIVYQDAPGSAQSFVDRLGRTYEYATDPGSRAAIDFGVFGVPETFFVDGNGVVRGRVAGPVNSEMVAGTLDRLLTDS